MNGIFKWQKRYFNELPEDLRFRIKNFNISVNKANRTLTTDELKDTFKRFQVTKKTLLGEQWNADNCNLCKILKSFVNDDEVNLNDRGIFMKRKPNRHQLLELYGTLFAYYSHGNVLCTRKMIEDTWSKCRHKASFSEHSIQWQTFRQLIHDMWKILESNPSLKKQQVATRARPLFGLLLHLKQHARPEIVCYLQKSLSLHEEKYEKIGGEHKGHAVRMKTLMESVEKGYNQPSKTIFVQSISEPFPTHFLHT